MQTLLFKSMLGSALLLTALVSFASDSYIFDPNHTYIIWRVDHFGFSQVSGKFFAEGSLSVDTKKPQNSNLAITIHTDRMNTGIPELDEVLEGENFFDTDHYKTAKFVTSKIQLTGKNTGKVMGILTIKNIAKPITLDVRLNNAGQHPYFNKKALGFSATGVINRSDFSMSGYTPGVSDKTTLEIQAEAEIKSP